MTNYETKSFNHETDSSITRTTSRLNKLMVEGDTLDAIVHDNTLQMNSAYMRYFVWFGAAVTLGLVAMHRAAK